VKNIGYLPSHGRPLPTYTGPPWKQPEPEVPSSEEDIARFLAAFPGVTCSPKTLRTLAALHRDFAIRSTEEP
jgi:hypothetical protein